MEDPVTNAADEATMGWLRAGSVGRELTAVQSALDTVAECAEAVLRTRSVPACNAAHDHLVDAIGELRDRVEAL